MPSTLRRVRLWVERHEYVIRVPWDTSDEEIDRLKRHKRVDVERAAEEKQAAQPPAPEPGTFAEDATRYLAAVKAMPTFSERERDIRLWCAEFGKLPRYAITPVMIRTVRDRWLTSGPKMVQRWVDDPALQKKRQVFVAVPGPLSASTVNHRLRALENLYTVLDGRHAANPVRDVPEADEDPGPPKALPVAMIEAILSNVSDQGFAAKGTERIDSSKARVRLHVLAWAGLTYSQLARLMRADVDWTEASPSIYLRRRKKGKGVDGHRVPITTRGLAALKMLDQADAWGGFTPTVVRRAWQLACDKTQETLAARGVKIDLSHVVPYALRHSHATATLAATGNPATAQALLSHRDPRTTLRYAAAAVPEWLQAAAKKLEAYRGETKTDEAKRTPESDTSPQESAKP